MNCAAKRGRPKLEDVYRSASSYQSAYQKVRLYKAVRSCGNIRPLEVIGDP